MVFSRYAGRTHGIWGQGILLFPRRLGESPEYTVRRLRSVSWDVQMDGKYVSRLGDMVQSCQMDQEGHVFVEESNCGVMPEPRINPEGSMSIA